MKFILLITIIIAGCMTPGEVAEMKADAKISLANISKISELVRVNLGTKEEAEVRKTLVDDTLKNIEGITANVKVVTAQTKTASEKLNEISQTIDAATKRINDPEIGVPELLRKVDTALKTINKSTGNVEKASASLASLFSSKNNLIKDVKTSTDSISKTLNKAHRIADKIEQQFAQDMIPNTIRSINKLAQKIDKTAGTFSLASMFLVGMSVLQVLCFAYAALMLYRANRQRARFEVMENLRALTENIIRDRDGNEVWKIPSRNIVFKANILRLKDKALPLIEALKQTDSKLMQEFLKEI